MWLWANQSSSDALHRNPSNGLLCDFAAIGAFVETMRIVSRCRDQLCEGEMCTCACCVCHVANDGLVNSRDGIPRQHRRANECPPPSNHLTVCLLRYARQSVCQIWMNEDFNEKGKTTKDAIAAASAWCEHERAGAHSRSHMNVIRKFPCHQWCAERLTHIQRQCHCRTLLCKLLCILAST